MLYESKHLWITAEYGVATLSLAFPGEPVNGLDRERLHELDMALAALEGRLHFRTLVVRSALPAGFCGGLRPGALAGLGTCAARGEFSQYGQQVFARLARLPFDTIAFIDGPCLGAGLELALACDFRLCVARPTTLLGFPDAPRGMKPCFGGSVRIGRRARWLLEHGRTLSGREALRIGLVQRAFCERRAKIELRTFLDERERCAPPLRANSELRGFATERRTFAQTPIPDARPVPRLPVPRNPVPPLPALVGLASDDERATGFVADFVLRGGAAVVWGEGDEVGWWIDVALGRGFVTPLEADQARGRVRVAAEVGELQNAGLVLADELPAAFAPRGIVAMLSEPTARPANRRALRLRFADEEAELQPFPDTDGDAIAALATWLAPFGIAVALAPAHRESLRAAA